MKNVIFNSFKALLFLLLIFISSALICRISFAAATDSTSVVRPDWSIPFKPFHVKIALAPKVDDSTDKCKGEKGSSLNFSWLMEGNRYYFPRSGYTGLVTIPMDGKYDIKATIGICKGADFIFALEFNIFKNMVPHISGYIKYFEGELIGGRKVVPMTLPPYDTAIVTFVVSDTSLKAGDIVGIGFGPMNVLVSRRPDITIGEVTAFTGGYFEVTRKP